MLARRWRKATWLPCGAVGLPAVNALPLPATPAPGLNVQGDPAGADLKAPGARAGVSNPESVRVVSCGAMKTPSMNAVLSPPFRFVLWKVTVWAPAATVKVEVASGV